MKRTEKMRSLSQILSLMLHFINGDFCYFFMCSFKYGKKKFSITSQLVLGFAGKEH